MGSAKKQGELWGQVPLDWALLQEPKHNPLFEAMLDAAYVSAGTQLLDAGCGGGGASLLASQRVAQVTGLDASEGLLNVARERIPSADFRLGDIQELPFEDAIFDAVIAPNSVQYAEDRVMAIRELGRVCKPDGRVVIGLFASSEKVEFRHIFKAMGDALPDPPKGGGPFALSVDGTLEALIEEAGLTIIEVNEVDCPFTYPDFETFWRGNVAAGPSRGILGILGEERFQSVMQKAVEAYTSSNGSIHIAPNFFKYVIASS